jgi:PAS domain S-box-containing protein
MKLPGADKPIMSKSEKGKTDRQAGANNMKHAGKAPVEISSRRQAEKLFGIMPGGSQVGIYIVQDKTFQFVNPRFREYTGYSNAALSKMNPLDIVHPEDRETVRSKAIRMLKGEAIHPYELRIIHKNGGTRWAVESVGSIIYKGKPATLGNFMDITEHKQAETALRESEEFRSSLLNISPNPIFIVDPDTSIRYANPALEKLTGFSAKELIGKKAPYPWWRKKYLKEVRAKLLEGMHQERRGEEAMFQKKNGGRFWVETSSIPVTIGGELRYILINWIDITDRKQAAQELNLRAQLLDNAGDSICLLDYEGNIVYANKKFGVTHGYSHEKLIGMNMRQLENSMPPEMTEHIIKELIEKGEAVFESTHTLADGSKLDLEIHSRGIKSGNKMYSLSIEHDITERKRMDQELKESEERYRALIELGGSVGEAIVMTQNTERGEASQIFFNGRWPVITGYSRKKLMGMSFFDLLHPRDREASIERYRKKIRGGETPGLIELTIIRKDGTEVPIEMVTASTIYRGKRAAVGYIRDITRRKEVERRIEELYEKEKEARLNLEDALTKRVEFARALVHELKTPLTPILAASELLAEEVENKSAQRLIASIERSASTLNTRIDTLLDLAKGEVDMLDLDLEEVDTLVFLNNISDEMLPVASSRNISLVLDVPTSLPSIRADESRLKQVVMNILSNALKWTPEEGRVTIRARENEDIMIIEVQDTGPGIARESQGRLFEAYYRVKNNRQRLGGLGLGLALSKTIVEAHNGKIWVDSAEGKGSTFSFSVPVCVPGNRRT